MRRSDNPAARTDGRSQAPLSARACALAATAAALVVLAGCALLPGRSGSGGSTVEVVSHTVSASETLASIADDYYGSPDAADYLADVNNVAPDQVLEPGAVVDVPVGADDIERYQRRTEAKILYNRGTLLADAGDYARAQEEFASALKADPFFVDAGYNLGVVVLAMGEHDRAAAIFEQVLEIAPDDPLTEFALGKAHFDGGRFGTALEHFERAVELDSSLEDARFARGVALLRTGEREAGIVALDAYLREFPGGAWADAARAELEKMAQEGER